MERLKSVDESPCVRQILVPSAVEVVHVRRCISVASAAACRSTPTCSPRRYASACRSVSIAPAGLSAISLAVSTRSPISAVRTVQFPQLRQFACLSARSGLTGCVPAYPQTVQVNDRATDCSDTDCVSPEVSELLSSIASETTQRTQILVCIGFVASETAAVSRHHRSHTHCRGVFPR